MNPLGHLGRLWDDLYLYPFFYLYLGYTVFLNFAVLYCVSEIAYEVTFAAEPFKTRW